MGNNMDDKVKITLSEHQHKLLLKHVEPYILDENTLKLISIAIVKNGKYYIYLAPDDLEDLIGSICFVINHEEKDKKLFLELEDLIDYLENILNE